MSRALLERALNALEESLGDVEYAYDNDWRNGLPSRKKEMDGLLALLIEHKAVIRDIRAELGLPDA